MSWGGHCWPKLIAPCMAAHWPRLMAKSTNPFRYSNSSPEEIRPMKIICVKYPLSPRHGDDMLAERGIDICSETVRLR